MAVRAISHDSVLVFLTGSGNNLLPPVPPTFDLGGQPADEKTLGFPSINGFYVAYSAPPIDVFGVEVDQGVQP